MADTNTGPDWQAVRAAVVGGLSTREAAKRFGVSYSTLAKRAASEGWQKSKEKVEKQVAAKVDQAIVKETVDKAVEANRRSEAIASAIEGHVAKLLHPEKGALGQALAMPAKDDNGAVDATWLTRIAAAMSTLTASARVAQDMKRKALGMDKAGSDGDGKKAALDKVLDRLEADGEIVGPVADVDEAAGTPPSLEEISQTPPAEPAKE